MRPPIAGRLALGAVGWGIVTALVMPALPNTAQSMMTTSRPATPGAIRETCYAHAGYNFCVTWGRTSIRHELAYNSTWTPFGKLGTRSDGFHLRSEVEQGEDLQLRVYNYTKNGRWITPSYLVDEIGRGCTRKPTVAQLTDRSRWMTCKTGKLGHRSAKITRVGNFVIVATAQRDNGEADERFVKSLRLMSKDAAEPSSKLPGAPVLF